MQLCCERNSEIYTVLNSSQIKTKILLLNIIPTYYDFTQWLMLIFSSQIITLFYCIRLLCLNTRYTTSLAILQLSHLTIYQIHLFDDTYFIYIFHSVYLIISLIQFYQNVTEIFEKLLTLSHELSIKIPKYFERFGNYIYAVSLILYKKYKENCNIALISSIFLPKISSCILIKRMQNKARVKNNHLFLDSNDFMFPGIFLLNISPPEKLPITDFYLYIYDSEANFKVKSVDKLQIQFKFRWHKEIASILNTFLQSKSLTNPAIKLKNKTMNKEKEHHISLKRNMFLFVFKKINFDLENAKKFQSMIICLDTIMVKIIEKDIKYLKIDHKLKNKEEYFTNNSLSHIPEVFIEKQFQLVFFEEFKRTFKIISLNNVVIKMTIAAKEIDIAIIKLSTGFKPRALSINTPNYISPVIINYSKLGEVSRLNGILKKQKVSYARRSILFNLIPSINSSDIQSMQTVLKYTILNSTPVCSNDLYILSIVKNIRIKSAMAIL